MRLTLCAAAAAAAVLAITVAPVAGHAQGWGYGSNPENHVTNGYIRNNGTVVEPYHATNPNSSTLDNYSSRGNVNPYTGQMGHRGLGY